MLRNLYYSTKPFVPRRALIAFRRNLIRFQKSKYTDVWPIDEKAGNSPEGWQGWPEGKQFALILTHDVETIHGYKKCEKLINLEKEAGFRSSFNFIPERYDVSPELRNLLINNGFEVGVHGLYHDGKLYKSKKIFMERAEKINHYIKEWKAVGFRSPSMHSNLEWLHALDIKYDASTFDTDPFEPQTGGVCTIFPFLVTDRSTQKSYVELPYTLSQDSTLFIFMGEDTIDIWKRKLDWIAEKGGMALLATHPDYMNFEDGNEEIGEYPVKLYIEFLNYIKEKYEGKYWAALPKDMAGHCKKNSSNIEKIFTKKSYQKINIGKNAVKVCMVVYSNYDYDNRVKRYATTLAKRGDQVDVFCLKAKGQSFYEKVNDVNVFRIQERYFDETSKYMYLFKIVRFFVCVSCFLAKKHIAKRYDVIHVHNVPDFLVFTAVLSKLTGAKIILDIHDIVPEFFVDKFKVSNNSPFYKILIIVERLSALFADYVIVSNDLWWNKLVSRSVEAGNCTTILNYPDANIFYYQGKKDRNGKFTIMYPGSLNWHQGLDIAINAFNIVSDEIPEVEFHIYGEGSSLNVLIDLVKGLGIEDRILFKKFLPLEQSVHVMACADLGIVPKRADGFGNEAFSTKILEFMALGVPVIVSNTKIDQFYFDESLVEFFKAGDEKDLGEKILLLVRNKDLRDKLAENSLKYIEDNNWKVKEHIYLDIVDKLVGNNNEA